MFAAGNISDEGPWHILHSHGVGFAAGLNCGVVSCRIANVSGFCDVCLLHMLAMCSSCAASKVVIAGHGMCTARFCMM
jgi:hypothetical protein